MGSKNDEIWPVRTGHSQSPDATPRTDAITTLVTPAEFAAASQSRATRRAYQSAIKMFSCWCREQGYPSFPVGPQLLATYLSVLASSGKSLSTVRKAKAAIDGVHVARDIEPPGEDRRVRMVLRGITRELGVAPATQKSPLRVEHLREIVRRLPHDLKGTRDRALLLLGFAGAFRRSELVALRVEDLAFEDHGVRVRIRRSKTDQEGRGHLVGIPHGRCRSTCPVRALESWLSQGGIEEGPVFRQVTRHGHVGVRPLSADTVAVLVKAGVGEAGLDPDRYAGHSLRAGLVSEAAAAGVEERLIAIQTRHRSMAVLRGYIREGTLFEGNAAAALGL